MKKKRKTSGNSVAPRRKCTPHPPRSRSNAAHVPPPQKAPGVRHPASRTTASVLSRRQTQAALRRERDLAQVYLDTVETIIVALNGDGRITAINRKACELLGWREDELLGQSWFATCLPQPEGMNTVYPVFQKMLAGKGAAVEYFENPILTRRGELRHIAWHNAPLRDEAGRIVGTVSSGEDITARKQAEEEVQRLNTTLEQRVSQRTAQLEAANQELESFSYSVSHDLRAPLRGIDGWSLALMEDYGDQLDTQARTYLNRVRAETQRMERLIDALLQLSRTTRAVLQKVPVDLTALARAFAADLRASAPERSVEFTIHPALCAMGDPHLLEAALSNLLDNAFKFTGRCPHARIEFGTTDVPQVPATPELRNPVVFFVRDNGAGFDMAHGTRLFGAFQRMHKVSEFPGTGIGLATVYRIIRRHGGSVWADAAVDRGATFYFILEGTG